jgi:hypothetical protein
MTTGRDGLHPVAAAILDFEEQPWPGKIRFQRYQLENADVIAREFEAAGFDEQMIAAAIANAMGESWLGRNMYGDNGDSVGLFQLNSRPRAAGAGMSVEERLDPTTNTRRIIQVVMASEPVMTAYRAGEDAGRLTDLFVRHVENPDNHDLNVAKRLLLLGRMFRDGIPAVGDGALVASSTSGTPTSSSASAWETWLGWKPGQTTSEWLWGVPATQTDIGSTTPSTTIVTQGGSGDATARWHDTTGRAVLVGISDGTTYGPGPVPPGEYLVGWSTPGRAVPETVRRASVKSGGKYELGVRNGRVEWDERKD